MKSLISLRNDLHWRIQDIEQRLPNARMFDREKMIVRQECYGAMLQKIEKCIEEQDRIVLNAAKKLVRKIIAKIEV